MSRIVRLQFAPRASADRARDAGFSLVALTIVLAILVTLVMLVVPNRLLGVSITKEDETRRQLALLVQVITGMPENQTFGFVGDVGRLPKSLEEINATTGTQTLCDATWNPGVTNYHLVDGSTEHRGHTSMGWRGPYVTQMFTSGDFLVDSWGQALRYTCPQSTKLASDPTTGGLALTLRTGEIASAGPDGVFDTADDIKSDLFYDAGNLLITVTVGNSTSTPTNITVTLYYPVNGEQTSVTSTPTTLQTQSGSQKLLAFGSLPAGVRFIDINMGSKSEFLHVPFAANVATAREYVVPNH